MWFPKRWLQHAGRTQRRRRRQRRILAALGRPGRRPLRLRPRRRGGAACSRAMPEGQGERFASRRRRALRDAIVDKAFVAVDGVSLTVAAAGDGWFEIALIPETLARTTLGRRAARGQPRSRSARALRRGAMHERAAKTALPRTAARTFEARLHVQWADVDVAGIVYFAAYWRFVEHAEMECSQSSAFRTNRVFNEYGFWLPRVRCEAEYSRAGADERLVAHAHACRAGRRVERHAGRPSCSTSGPAEPGACFTFVVAASTRGTRKAARCRRDSRARCWPASPQKHRERCHALARRYAPRAQTLELREEPAPKRRAGRHRRARARRAHRRHRSRRRTGADIRRCRCRRASDTSFPATWPRSATVRTTVVGRRCASCARIGTVRHVLLVPQRRRRTVRVDHGRDGLGRVRRFRRRSASASSTRNCFRKPAGVSYAEAAFLEPLACVVHSLRALDAAPGSTVAIVGNGAFGILHALLLQRNGVSALLFGRRPQRVALARDLGIECFDTNDAPIERRGLGTHRRTRRRRARSNAPEARRCGNGRPSFVRRGGTVSFFGGLAAPDARELRRGAAALRRSALDRAVSFHACRRARRRST